MTEVEELRERIKFMETKHADELTILREKFKHMEVHHADALEDMRVTFKVRLKSIITNLESSQVAMTRNPPKVHVMEHMVQDSIEIARDTYQLYPRKTK